MGGGGGGGGGGTIANMGVITNMKYLYLHNIMRSAQSLSDKVVSVAIGMNGSK